MLTVRYLRPQPSAFQCWWRENARTVLGLAVWAATLLQCASLTPLAQTDLVQPYRVEAIEGAVFIQRQDSQAACEAAEVAEVATAVCVVPDDPHRAHRREGQEPAP